MCEKILRGTRQYITETGNLLVLNYYITKKPMNTAENYYGIEINSQRIVQGNEATTRYNHLLLSECKAWVEEIIDKFIGNGVTPDTMEYIIDDIMGVPC